MDIEKESFNEEFTQNLFQKKKGIVVQNLSYLGWCGSA